MSGDLHRLAAFAAAPGGGNPAGVWIGDTLPAITEMQRIAAEVGASETAFIAPRRGDVRTVRYFSPEVEVSFCGHATIASGAAIGSVDGPGRYDFETAIGTVRVEVRMDDGEQRVALESVEPSHRPIDPDRLGEYLIALRWDATMLDDWLPPALAYAGAWHLVLLLCERATLAALDYDFDALKALMQADGLTTLQLAWREDERRFHVRNPFPVGGVVEDPATGAAAAALGGYLRALGRVETPARVTIEQGYDMGRPSRILVDVPANGGIVVSGSATTIEG